MNGLPSSKIFAPPKNKLTCPEECTTCQLTTKTNKYLTKQTVYKITCTYCSKVYIGETARTVGSRIKEHLRMKKQTVYMHLITHDLNPSNNPPISWEILHYNLSKQSERRTIEA